MTTKTTRHQSTQPPWLWLQEDEVTAAAGLCACHLDSTGPKDEPGAAFYMCPLHATAPDMNMAIQQFVAVYRDHPERLGNGQARRSLAAFQRILAQIEGL